jgi:Zn-dependent peptidase ImmA (M78 family)
VEIPQQSFQNVLLARGLDLITLAQRSGVSKAKLKAVSLGEGGLDDDEVIAVAEELAVPVQALFSKNELPLFPAVDFRTVQPSIGEFSKGTLNAISFVESLSSTFAALDLDTDIDASVRAVSTQYTKKEAVELAKKWRKNWGIKDSDQLDWQDANKMYGSLRSFIEGLGVLVLHRQFQSDEAAGMYVHVDSGPHTIVINTTHSSKARKLFTLAHEFCHVLLRAEGASNPSILRNKVERFCNRFAACLLAPKRLIEKALVRFTRTPSTDPDFIRLFAKNLGISQEALFLRLVETGYLDRSDYQSWKAKFSGTIPTGDTSDGGGGGQSDPLQTKRTIYGSALLSLLDTARRLGQLDEIDIYRLCGLKPKYQNQLFEAI